MASITKAADFVGEYKLPTDNFSKLDTYITEYERFYLIRLLGAVLYDLLITDFAATDPQTPTAARFSDIFNEFHKDEDEGVVDSEGMKRMLVQFIYFHYLRDLPNQNSLTGVVRNTNSNSVPMGNKGFNLVETYNKGVDNYNAIQWFIDDDSATYTEENMQYLESTSGI